MVDCDKAVAWRPVGRSAEFSSIVARAEQAAAGNAGLVVVRGAKGSGKSTLLSLVHEIAGVTVLHTRCREVAGPFAAARGLLDLFERVAPATARPVLRGEPVCSSGDDPADEYRVLHGLYRLVVDLATDRPLVLVLDDAHHCDGATARWLDFTLRRAADLPLLVVLAHPRGASSAGGLLFAELSDHVHTTVLELGPLDRAAVAELLAGALSGNPDAALLDVCLDVTEGNPMRLRELADRLAVAGTGSPEGAVDRARAFGSTQAAASSLRWLRGQDAAVRDVAKAAALLGGTGSAALGALCGRSTVVTSDAVAALVRNEVLTADGGVFRHVGVRDALLAELPPEDLGELRVRAARLLSDEGRPFEEIAHQLVSVPVLTEPWMSATLRAAARVVTTAGSPEAAVRYLERVLEAAPGHVDVRIELATALAASVSPAALDRFADVVDGIDDPAVRASVAARCGIAALASHRVPDILPVLQKVLLGLPDDVDAEIRTDVESTLLAVGSGDCDSIRATVRWAQEIGTPEADTPARCRMLQALAWVEVFSGGSARTAAEFAAAHSGDGSESRSWWTLSSATVLHLAGQSKRALDMVDAVALDSARRSDAWCSQLASRVRGYIGLCTGELLEAEADAETAIGIAESAGRPEAASAAKTILAAVLVRREETARADALLASLGPARDGIERSMRSLVRAQVRRSRGDREGALELVLRCGRDLDEIGMRDPIFAPWWLDATCLLAELGRPAEAAGLVVRGEEFAARWGTAEARGLALLARGVIRSGRARVGTLEAAVTELENSTARLAEILGLSLLGCAVADVGDLKSARAHLRTAVDLAVRCGDLAAATAARSMLRRAGGRMASSSVKRVNALTGSERRVGSLAAYGLTNRQIAEKLFVTVRTVESHLSNVYRKLGVHVRADLAGRMGPRA